MKCDKGHDMQAILCHVRPESSEYFCDICHQSKEMPMEHFYAHTGQGRPQRPAAPAGR